MKKTAIIRILNQWFPMNWSKYKTIWEIKFHFGKRIKFKEITELSVIWKYLDNIDCEI